MPALEKRVACLEKLRAPMQPRTTVVQFVSPTRGLVGLRCGDLTMDRLDHETEVQFLLRAKKELSHADA